MKQLCLLVLTLLCLNGHTQTELAPAVYKPLRIGDAVPDVYIRKISNYKSQNLRMSELKGKVVILDFWFGACKSCYTVFPKLEALQEKYGDRIQILTVNFESEEKINSTFRLVGRSSSTYRMPKLPTVISDTVFHQLFPVKYYPHEVWIDPEGIVVATTSAEEITPDRVQKLLNKEPIKVDMKIDLIGFDNKKAVLPQVYLSDPLSLRYYSVLLKSLPGAVGTGVTKIIDTLNHTVRITRMNQTLLRLFTCAITDYGPIDPFSSVQFDFGKRVDLRVKDSGHYIYFPSPRLTKGEWMAQNSFTYEMVLPRSQQNNWQANMRLDLERYFSVSCRVEKRRMRCLALVRTSDNDRLKSKESRVASISDSRNDPNRFQLFYGNTRYLLNAISEANRFTPFIFADATGYSGRIDIDLALAMLGDLPRLKEELRRKYDLDLVEKEVEVDVLVFEEK